MQLTEYKLSDIGTVITGKTPPGSKDESFGGNVFFLTPTDMDGARTPSKIERTLSELGKQQLQRLIVPRGVAVSCIGSQMGKSCLMKSPFATNQQINTIVPHESKVDLDFLYYLLSSMREYLLRLGVGAGSTMPILNKGNFENITVSIPGLNDQKKIASILSVLDDKIELNNQINETLESIAKAIFKEWFIDFGPVKAKSEGKKPIGMDAETASLFPESFEDSELGLIPKGWEVKSFGDISNCFDSKRVPLSGAEREKRKGTYPYYGAASHMGNVDDFLFDGVYVLMGEDGSVVNEDGSPVLQYVWGKFWVNNHAHVLTGKDISTEHLSLFLKHTIITPYVTGAVQPKLNQGNMNSIPFVKASPAINATFTRIIEPLYMKIRGNKEENDSLTQTRDLLLPKLISGEISLNDV